MNCSELRSRVSELLDEELSYSDAKRFHAHLDGCSSCAEFFAGLEQMKLILVQAPPVGLKPDFIGRLQERLNADLNRRATWWQQLTMPGRTGWSPLSLGSMAAAALAAVLVGVSLFESEAAPIVAPPTSAVQPLNPAGRGTNPVQSNALPRALQAAASVDSTALPNDSSRRDFSRQLKLVDQKRP